MLPGIFGVERYRPSRHTHSRHPTFPLLRVSPQGVSTGGNCSRGGETTSFVWALSSIVSPLAAVVAGKPEEEIDPIPETERLRPYPTTFFRNHSISKAERLEVE